MTEAERVLLDSSILLYAYNPDEKEKYHVSKGLLEQGFFNNRRYYLSLQNLGEFFRVATEKMRPRVSTVIAQQIVKDFLVHPSFVKVSVTSTALELGMEISAHNKLHFWDALIAATMKENNIFKIYTENTKDFSKIPWLTTINPFGKSKR